MDLSMNDAETKRLTEALEAAQQQLATVKKEGTENEFKLSKKKKNLKMMVEKAVQVRGVMHVATAAQESWGGFQALCFWNPLVIMCLGNAWPLNIMCASRGLWLSQIGVGGSGSTAGLCHGGVQTAMDCAACCSKAVLNCHLLCSLIDTTGQVADDPL